MSDRTIQGETISPGRVVGNICILPAAPSGATGSAGVTSGEPAEEARRFRREADALVEELREAVSRLEEESMSAEADIIRAHVAMLQDPEFHRRVHTCIEEARHAAEQAVEHVLMEMADLMASAEDEALAERATDFRDLAGQLKARLAGDEGDLDGCIRGVDDAIQVAEELRASMVLKARAAGARGFIVTRGTGLSHGAILAKSFGLPAIRIRSLDPLQAASRRPVLLDADAGKVVIEPDATELQVVSTEPEPPRGPDKPLPGRLWLSIVDPAQLDGVDWTGIEGVGLYRTEILFMQHSHDFPGEDEQLRAYGRLFDAAGDRPVVIRTADLGADKPVAHMSFGPQQNPYLGLRAHRIFRFHPEILVTQVRAILRAAAGARRLRLMFPMLETVDQWRFVQQLVGQATEGLRADGIEYQSKFEQGVLIETPSAAWSFDEFLKVIDFASVGTNDLVQYFFAVERDTANVADLYQPEHPALLRLLKSLADQALQAGKPLSICGEVAADSHLAPVLIGLGIEDLSVAPPQVLHLRQLLAAVTGDECRRLADDCLAAAGIEDVRRLLGMPLRPKAEPAAQALPEGHAVDPVCGMIVHTADAHFTLERDGQRYFFCSGRCMRRFRRAGLDL